MQPTELVARLWRDVESKKAARERLAIPELAPHETLLHSDTLRHINTTWEIALPEVPPAAGRFAFAKGPAKERAAQFVLQLLQRYFNDDRAFRAQLVRFSNSMAMGHDRLASEVREVAAGMRIESERLSDRIDVVHRDLDARLRALESAGGSADA